MSEPGGLRHLLRERTRRRTAWIVAAALAPLALLLAFQYRWLVRLEKVSEVAHRATLDNYLAAVVSGVELHYRALGERALNVPAAIFTAERIGKAKYHFDKKAGEGARRLFVVPLVGEKAGQPLVYDAATRTLAEPEWGLEARASHVAVAPWKVLAMKHGTLERPALQVEDRDPGQRMILNPITDEGGRVVGLAGLFVDREELERVVLPRVVSEALPKLEGEETGELPVVAVRDPAGRELVFKKAGKGPAVVASGESPGDDAVRALGFPFRDWEIGIRSRHRTPAAWARRNFQINLALSAVLAAVVAGGVLFALRAAARELRLSQMKSDFVSNVSHELRTPLASIRVFGELLRLGRVESPEKTREYGELIETESRRLTGLIDNILDLARIESGRKSYRLVPADLEEVVAETLRTFRVSLAPSGFRVSYAGATERLPPVAIDPAAIAQAVANLLDNAVKYSAPKASHDAREVEVAVRREGAFAVVAVADHGIGIPRSEQAKIFERFHRVPPGGPGSLVHDVKGSGLGLAIVRHVAEAHRGRIELASRPGEGSTFELWLPLAASAEAAGESAARITRTSEA